MAFESGQRSIDPLQAEGYPAFAVGFWLDGYFVAAQDKLLSSTWIGPSSRVPCWQIYLEEGFLVKIAA